MYFLWKDVTVSFMTFSKIFSFFFLSNIQFSIAPSKGDWSTGSGPSLAMRRVNLTLDSRALLKFVSVR